ncbi:gluconate 2-dehydrogenase subunit 3 family protein [Gemmatimonas sp.]|uniref:gluconate 2-dehydrogenase subunit 3 family protein n=1 Tax=Gemmatimonas sp. TaxID=1962908 RepID=UPI00356171BF
MQRERLSLPVRDVSYPAGSLRDLLNGPHVSAATRVALLARIATSTTTEPRFFEPSMFATLRCVCVRFVPEAESICAEVAAMIDARLADGTGNGWRFNDMPSDGDCYRMGLKRIDELSLALHDAPFALLDGNLQDNMLQEANHIGNAPSVRPSGFPARFFEELLVEVVECAYSHPLMQEHIGYAGMADLPQWTTLTLDALEDREPRPLRTSHA